MSNTADVSIYDEYSSDNGTLERTAEGVSKGATVSGAATLKWLLEDTAEQKSALQKAREEDRELLIRQTLQLSSVALTLRDERALVRSAETLGYQTRSVAPNVLMLESITGQRMAITRSAKGTLVAHSNRGKQAVTQVVRHHNLDQVQRHLKTIGMSFTERKNASGEIELIGVEQRDVHDDGRAAVNIQVRQDGSLHIDVDRTIGPRCEQLVAGIAQATGGRVENTNRKHSYFERPGEVAKTKVRI